MDLVIGIFAVCISLFTTVVCLKINNFFWSFTVMYQDVRIKRLEAVVNLLYQNDKTLTNKEINNHDTYI
jgi:hypothetical protein